MGIGVVSTTALKSRDSTVLAGSGTGFDVGSGSEDVIFTVISPGIGTISGTSGAEAGLSAWTNRLLYSATICLTEVRSVSSSTRRESA